MNQTVMGSRIGVPAPDRTLFACLQVHLAPSALRLPSESAAHSACRCGYGGTRNRRTRVVKIFELAFPLKVTLLSSSALPLVFYPTITTLITVSFTYMRSEADCV